MRKTEVFALILSILFCCNSLAQTQQQKGRVLMIVNEDQSADLELMLTKEVGIMKDLLQKAGFQVVVATASKRPLEAGYLKLQPDLKLSDVRSMPLHGKDGGNAGRHIQTHRGTDCRTPEKIAIPTRLFGRKQIAILLAALRA